MVSAVSTDPWRGYLNQVTHNADLRGPLDDDAVERIVDELLRQRVFTSPVGHYYAAAVAGLRSGKRLSSFEDQDEDATRDAVTRIVQGLDERRPWPVAPFYQQEPSGWDRLAGAPVIARVPLSQREVRYRLNRGFDSVGAAGDEAKVMILQLRTGQLVALRSTASFTAPGMDLLAHADLAATVRDFAELTGLVTEPA